jgi:UDP-glucose 4-epimerase
MFNGKCILITGGTGSFGNAVLKHLLQKNAGEIRIFSRDEKKQDDMRREIDNNRVRFYIGDVRDEKSVFHAMEGVDYVFHAAALKQVPSCEFFPMEAFHTNVVGTENVLNCAIRHKVKNVVCLSSDKAVYPVNTMGLSKAMMEKVMAAKARTLSAGQTTLCATRYGNLICSRGSVIPTLISQIRKGMPLTVTDPAMTRFLMTVEEAVQLVLFAFEHAEQGDIFVKKSPSALLGDLVQALIELFNAPNPVKTIGLRHGEKLYETLLTRQEMFYAEDMGDFFRIPLDTRSLNYNTYSIGMQHSLLVMDEYHSQNASRLNISEIKEILLRQEEVQRALEEYREMPGRKDDQNRYAR